MSTTGGLATKAPHPEVGGRRPGREVRAEALACQGHPLVVDVGQRGEGSITAADRHLVVGPEGHRRIRAHASELSGPVEDEDVPSPLGARRTELEVELLGAGVESADADQRWAARPPVAAPTAGRTR